MNYKDAYCHLRRSISELISRLEQPQADYTPADTAAGLYRMTVESEEILTCQNPSPVHKASRRGSSIR